MTVLPNMTTKPRSYSWFLILAAAVLGALLPVLIYQLLPMIGIEQFKDLLSLNNILALCIAPCLLFGYCAYIAFLCKKPGILTLGYWLIFPWMLFANRLGIINPTPTSFLLFLIPISCISFYQLLKNPTLWKRVPYFIPNTLFVLAMLFYYFFYQEEIMDQRSNAGQFTLGFYYLCTMYSNLAQTSIMVIGDQYPLFNQKFLKYFNRAILFSTLVVSIIGILGYPFDLFNILDNFTRRGRSIFHFPAAFANYIAFCVIYLTGYWLYCQDTKKSKLTLNLTLAACILGFIGLLLSFAKATIFAFAVAMVIIVLLNISSWGKALHYLKYVAIITLITAGAVFGYEKMSGNSITGSLIQRASESGSSDWRDRMNRYLVSDVDLTSVWFGHGMSASKIRMSMFESFGRDTNNGTSIGKVVHVHNSYLSQIYDYGLIGISVFIVLALFAFQRLLLVFQTPHTHPNRIFNITIIALIVCLMVISIADTVFELSGSPFWFLLTAATLAEGRIRRQWA